MAKPGNNDETPVRIIDRRRHTKLMGVKERKPHFDIEELRPPVLSLPIISESERASCEICVIGSQGDKYKVNLIEMTCTCPDWMECRVRFTRPDIRRACKHIASQFANDRFVLRGEKLYGTLVPVPALECGFGGFRINGSLVLFRCEPKRRCYFEVLAESKGNQDSTDLGRFRTDMFRWFDRPVPRYSEQIKRYLKNWLKNQPEFEEELPPFPQSVLDRFAELEQQEELDNEKCFVCGYQLFFSDKTPEFLYIGCPCCECINVLTRSGHTNTPERLRLYRKYDGDLYDKNYPSLKRQTERELERKLRLYKKMRAVGELTPFQFENQLEELQRETDARLIEIRMEKERELDQIRKREREIRDRVHRRG